MPKHKQEKIEMKARTDLLRCDHFIGENRCFLVRSEHSYKDGKRTIFHKHRAWGNETHNGSSVLIEWQ